MIVAVASRKGSSSSAKRASSTWWPSASQSFAASRAAATQVGCVGVPFHVSVWSAMRSRPGWAATSARKGRAGGCAA